MAVRSRPDGLPGRFCVALLGAAMLAAPGDAASALPGHGGGGSGAIEERRESERLRLERIRSEIRELRERLERTESAAGSIVGSIDRIDLQTALLARERESLRRDQEEVGRREASTRREAAEVKQRLAETERDLREWMREAYKLGPTRYLRIVAVASSPPRVAAAMRSIEALSLREAWRVEAYRSDRARLAVLSDDLAADRRRLARLHQQMRAQESNLRRLRQDKEALLASVREERDVHEHALAELLDLESEIQALLASLREGRSRDRVADLGFERFRGILIWPVRGVLAVPFGNVRHPKFGTEVPHPGIDIAASPGQEVTAVFDGRVVFSDWFRGYGPMIVIDHGEDYLSVYGHLGVRLVEVGDEIRQGDVIARSGEGGTAATAGLYFEIRHGGTPQDPAQWLLKEPGTIAGAAAGEAAGRAVPGSSP